MALLDEQLVEEWLNRQQFFTMRGIKCGVDEIDLLAVKYDQHGAAEHWHVEVQVSYRPISYIGGDTNARKRTRVEIDKGAKFWVEKKFTSQKKYAKREEILPSAVWRYVFVHGEVKDSYNLECIERLGVTLIPYRLVLEQLRDGAKSSSSSVASNIVEMLRYLEKRT
jgi:hypothetical protein